MKTPDNNSIDFEPTTIEDAANTESPAEYAARMKESSERFDLPQENLIPGNDGLSEDQKNYLELLKDRPEDQKMFLEFFKDHPEATITKGSSEEVARQQAAHQNFLHGMDREEQRIIGLSKNTAPRTWGIERSVRPDLKIESFDDLKEGMRIKIDTEVGGIVEALIGQKHQDNGTIDIEFDSTFIAKGGKRYPHTEIYPRQMTSDVLLLLQKLNNDHNAIWFRRKVGDLIKFKASDGKIFNAYIQKFFQDGSVVITVEMGDDYENIVIPATEVDSMDNENEGSGITETESNHQEGLDSTMENTKKVEATNSFEELFSVMDSFGESIPSGVYGQMSTQELKNEIKKYRNGDRVISLDDLLNNRSDPSNVLKAVTRTFGLRRKVFELMKEEESGMLIQKDGTQISDPFLFTDN